MCRQASRGPFVRRAPRRASGPNQSTYESVQTKIRPHPSHKIRR